MVREADSWKDLAVLINCRIENLKNKRFQLIKELPPRKREKALLKLYGRVRELKHIKMVINGNIRQASKQEYKMMKERENDENR